MFANTMRHIRDKVPVVKGRELNGANGPFLRIITRKSHVGSVTKSKVIDLGSFLISEVTAGHESKNEVLMRKKRRKKCNPTSLSVS